MGRSFEGTSCYRKLIEFFTLFSRHPTAQLCLLETDFFIDWHLHNANTVINGRASVASDASSYEV